MEVISDINSNEAVVYLTPNREELLPNYELKCEISMCNAVFTNAGNLQLHLRKHHNIKLTKETKKVKTLYCCPEKICTYNKKSKQIKSFASLKYLKQHYQKVHAEKNFKCTECPKAFAALWMLVSHKSECGKKFVCQVCNTSYNSSEALLTHAKRKKHHIKCETENNNNLKVEIPRLVPIVHKNADPLPMMYLVQFPEKVDSEMDQKIQTAPQIEDYLTDSPDGGSIEIITQQPEYLTNDGNPDSKGINLDEINFTNDIINNPFDQLVSNSLCDIETQTEFDETSAILDEMLYSNNYTQTCDEFLSELGLADIQTQTNWSTFNADQDSSTVSALQDESLVSTETQTTISQCLFDSCEGITQHTQTCDALLKGWFSPQSTDLIGSF